MEKLKPCPFCGENKAKLVRINEVTQEEMCVDAEELENSDIYAYVHCYGCDIDFCSNSTETPKRIMELWNRRACLCKQKEN